MKTFLIARAKFQDRDYKGGIDSIINLDYMGSSEFEWGAMPESLGKIRSAINEYTYLDVPIKDKVITVFCNNSQKTDVKVYLEQLSENKMSLQEYSAFDSYINNEAGFRNKSDFWWDIENHLMFWKKNPAFELKFKTIIATKPA